MVSETTRDACLRAFLDLLGKGAFERISLNEVAAHAGVSLSEMRGAFGSTTDLLDAFFKATDRQVLAEGGPDDGIDLEEPSHERLFEVLMRRLDALEPHRDAVASLLRSARRDAFLALNLLRLSIRSQRWMLAAAGIDTTGLSGDIRARGLAVMFGRLLDVWLKDEDPGLARTMARLDGDLREGAKLLGMLDDLASIASFGRRPRRMRTTEELRDGVPGDDRPSAA